MTTLQQPLRTPLRTPDRRPVLAPSDDVAVPAFESRAVTRARSLGDLLVRRPDLAGVYKPADVATEAIRWSA